MQYRIVELASPTANPTTASVKRRFDSAYRAKDALRDAVRGGAIGAKRWYLIDPAGRILLRPEDVDDLAA
jgi:hypothetical protein